MRLIVKNIFAMIALLLMATVANAQHKVVLEDNNTWGGDLKSESSFSGSNIKESKNRYSTGKSSRDYTATVAAGETINAACSATYVHENKKLEYHIWITITYYFDGDKKPVSSEKHVVSKPLNVSSKVPADAIKAELQISCGNGQTRGPQGTLCFVQYEVR